MRKIIFADDESSILNLYGIYSKKYFPDIEIEKCSNGLELEEILKKGSKNILAVVTDNVMRGKQGIELIKKYANTDEFQDTPFLLAYGDEIEIGERALKNGARKYFRKQFGLREIFEYLKKELPEKVYQ